MELIAYILIILGAAVALAWLVEVPDYLRLRSKPPWDLTGRRLPRRRR